MKELTALSRLRDEELCIVTTQEGEREVRWSVDNWCFYYLAHGTPVVCKETDIEEWRPAGISL